MNSSIATKPNNNTSIKLLVSYSDSSDSEEENNVVADAAQERRSVSSYDSESDSESSSSSSITEDTSSSDDSDTDDSKQNDISKNTDPLNKNAKNVEKSAKCTVTPGRTRGELALEDLPPIQDLHISVDKTEVQLLGHVLTIVDSLVTIQAQPGIPALNLDTMLFDENGEAFGQVFDVFGKVSQPLYAVRFNSNIDIHNKNISVRMPIYFAPLKEEFTAFVFADKLKNMKGCDASWKDDNEPPENMRDYSDDEEERMAKNKSKGKINPNAKEGERLPSNERPALRINQGNTNQASGNRRPSWKERNATRLDASNNGYAPHPQPTFANNPQMLPFMRPPVFNYFCQPGPANLTSQQGIPQSMSSMAFPPSAPPYYSFNSPPPGFPIKTQGSHYHERNFPVFRQMQPDGYQNLSGSYPNPFINTRNNMFMSPPPPPPLTSSFSSGSPSGESMVSNRVQVESLACDPLVSNSEANETSSNLLPNPFRKTLHSGPVTVESSVPVSSISPFESSSIPMFPPSGFLAPREK